MVQMTPKTLFNSQTAIQNRNAVKIKRLSIFLYDQKMTPKFSRGKKIPKMAFEKKNRKFKIKNWRLSGPLFKNRATMTPHNTRVLMRYI